MRDDSARRLFAGQLISQTCDKMMSVGLVWLFTAGYPPSVIPWFLGISALPHLLLAWSAGPWAAKLGQVRTLVATDLFRGAVFLLLALVWPAVGVPAHLAVLFGVSFAANFASALFNPAILASPVVLVEARLVQKLTALVESCFNVGNVVGPLLAVLLYPWIGLRGLFWLNGASYLVAALCERRIRARAAAAEPGQAGEPEADETEIEAAPVSPREVLGFDALVRAMLGGFLASNLFLAPIMVIMPLFVRIAWHGTLTTLGTLETCFGIGTIVGGAALSAVRVDTGLGRKIALGMSAVALCYLAFTLCRAPWQGYLCLVLLGFGLATTNVLSMTVFQTRLPTPAVPTLMSLVNLISVASLPLSMAVVGVAVAHFDVRGVALFCSAGLMLATAAVVARRDLRQL